MKYKVLILEDNEMDASLMEQFLNRSEYNFEIEWVATGEDYEKAISEFDPDVIISDYRLKNYSGLDAIHHKNIVCENVPLVIVSGTIGEEKAVELIKKGATDFLIKNNIASRLVQTVMRAIKESLEKEKRQKAEIRLKSSEERFRLLFEHSIDGIIIGNPDSEEGVLAANEAACKMLGYSFNELRGKVKGDFIETDHPESIKKLEEYDQTGFFQGELKVKTKSGTLLPVEVSSRIMKLKGGERRSYYILRDISERKQYELKLKKEKAFTEKALNSLPGIFYVLDENNRYIRINDNVEQELGYSWAEMEGMSPLDLYLPEDRDRVEKEIEKAFTDGQASTVARLKKKDGTSSHYFLTGAHFEEDGAGYILGTATDISDRIEAQHKIEESLKEKETLLKEIHHRVKNNLAIVSSMMQLQAFNSQNEEFYNEMLNSVSRIKSIALIHDYLYQNDSLTRIELSSNLKELIQKIKDTFSSETQINYNFDLKEVTLNVNQAVPFALMINEIITNIYKHAFVGRKEGEVDIKLKEKGNAIKLEITDNGVGLPQNFDLERAETIGLTLIKTLGKQLNAHIEFSSAKKTAFRLEFERSENKGSSNALSQAFF